MTAPKFSFAPSEPNHLCRRASQYPSADSTTGAVQTALVKAIPNGNGLTIITPGSLTVTPSPAPDVTGKGGIKSPPALSAPIVTGATGQ